MNAIERLHRWTIELLLFLCAFFGLSAFFENPVSIVFSFILAHSVNVLMNGHLFAMFAHDLFWFSLYKDRQKFFSYVEEIRNRLQRKAPKCICGAIFFGSLVRGAFRDSSDLDIRFISENGFWNAIGAAHRVFLERVRAVLVGFPIDIYMIRNRDELIKKMDVINETPVCLYHSSAKLDQIVPEIKSFDRFTKDFFHDYKRTGENLAPVKNSL